jgi:hypothetical protein
MNAWNAGTTRSESGVGDVMLDPHVDEAHAVLEPKDFVGEAVQLSLVQLGEHRLDQLLILLGRSGLAR